MIMVLISQNKKVLCNVARNYFDSLFMVTMGKYGQAFSLFHQVVSEEDNAKMLRPIAKEEPYKALCGTYPKKSLEPEGFNPTPCQKFWDLYGNNIWQAATYWLARGYFFRQLLMILTIV